jgi:uncharacterized protein (TIGR00730 family)
VRITVFGGSAPKAGEPAYQAAYQLGRMIGQDGDTLLTGGYIGTMEAASHGCADAGGHVIGVTCDEIEAWRPVKPNKWVMEEIRLPTVKQRLFTLIEECDHAIALPGGVGTLAEIAMMWNQMQVQAIAARRLVVVGDGWRSAFEAMFAGLESYIPPHHRELISFAADTAEAHRMINQG